MSTKGLRLKLRPDEIDTFLELINLGLGQSAAMLGELLGEHLHLSVPRLLQLDEGDAVSPLLDHLQAETITCVESHFQELLQGQCVLVFSNANALKLVQTLNDEDGPVLTLDTLSSEILVEVGNIVINGLIGSLANHLELGDRLKVDIPHYRESTLAQLLTRSEHQRALLLQVDLSTHELEIEAAILICLTMTSMTPLQTMLRQLVDQSR